MKNTSKRVFKLISIVFFIFAITISVRYAILSDTVSVHGIAKTVTYYPGTNMPGVFLPVSGTDMYSYSYKRPCEKRTSNLESDEGNHIYVTHTKNLCGANNRTVDYTVKFQNTTELTWTDGTASAEITLNDRNYVSNATASVDSTTILPGETATLTLTITANFWTAAGDQVILGTYSYTCQNMTKYIYFQFTYDGN